MVIKLTTEYLINFDKESLEAVYNLCDNVDAFNKMLSSSDPDIIISNNEIIFNTVYKYSYHIITNTLPSKQQRFFHVIITYNGEEEDMEEYVKLLHSIKKILYNSGGQPETLCDDVFFYYSQKAYPLIHKIENLMRKLITYFMLTTIGIKWVEETLPNIVKNAIENSKRKQYIDVLYSIDFIVLGDLLFKPYQVKDINDLLKIVSNAKKIDDLKLDTLKSFIEKSNWEKYFSKIIDCPDEYLHTRWEKIYDLRCSVAHNALINKEDFERLTQLVSEIEIHLQKAIENLDKIHVPKADIEQVAENIALNINTMYSEFIKAWRKFEKAIYNAVYESGLVLDKNRGIYQCIKVLRENDIIDSEYYEESIELLRIRNIIVHDSQINISDYQIQNYISILESLASNLKLSWKDIIKSTIIQLGGEANLTEIYDFIESKTTKNLPNAWKSIIRRILQTYCSDTKTYQGGEDIFRHISSGRWGIK